MLRVIADTHALIWYLFSDVRLSPTALAAIQAAIANGDQIGFSVISLVEIVYLAEKQRIPPTTLPDLLQLTRGDQPILEEVPLDQHIAQAVRHVNRVQVPDLPDRIITATALHLGLPLISRDHKIQPANVTTIW